MGEVTYVTGKGCGFAVQQAGGWFTNCAGSCGSAHSARGALGGDWAVGMRQKLAAPFIGGVAAAKQRTGAVSKSIAAKPHGEISVILQEYGLFPWKTVEQNIALPLLLQKRTKAERQQRTAQLMEQLQLAEHRKKYPAQLSGGQRQRVACPGVIASPKVLLMDEPFLLGCS